MKHVIIGTAGHVDHGKTLLVKALTGIDTDRLKEEKKRGITIELGFAHIEFKSGLQAGIIDVPGHERFIKNMLAGAGGVDFAMLVIAADESFMPQTVEHLGILSLLGISHGLVVITKADLVDSSWLEMVREDVVERVKGTFLEGAPIVPVSAYTGEGIDGLRDRLEALVLEAGEKNTFAPFRIPIDRVFSVDGFGTVVTGTLTDGQLNEGEALSIYPQALKTRVRNLQVHDHDVSQAFAGQRVAVNLAGLHHTEVERGMVLAKPGSVECTLMLDVRLNLLAETRRTIKSGTILHLYHGSATVLCKAVLLDCDTLSAGESALAQLRLNQPLAVRERDRFVVRFYSPLETIGGGVVLDAVPQRHKRQDPAVLAALHTREDGTVASRVLQAVAQTEADYSTFAQAIKALPLPLETIDRALALLLERGEVCQYAPGRYLTRGALKRLEDETQRLLHKYHTETPLSPGMRRDELRQKLFGRLDAALCDGIIALLAQCGALRPDGVRVGLPDFEVVFTPHHKRLAGRIEAFYEAGGFAPPDINALYAQFPKKEQEVCRQVVDALLACDALIMISPQILFARSYYDRAESLMRAHFQTESLLTLGQMRDLLGTSRKYALAMLEYWDRMKMTRMAGEGRILI